MEKTPVLIIGAGPTGLTLACELARRNIEFRIVERSTEYPRGSRAKGVQPRSLEVFNDLGIAQQALAAGTTNLPFRRFKGNESSGDVQRPDFPRPDTQFTRTLIVPQWKVEELLRGKLSEYGVIPELGTELLSFTQTPTGVEATLQRAGASKTNIGTDTSRPELAPKTIPGTDTPLPPGIEVVSCDYMIGCDGGKSYIRKALDINFAGETHEDERLLVGDVEIEGLTPDAWHIWTHPVYGFGVALCPFAHTKTWQFQGLALPDERGHLPEPTLENFNRVFQSLAQMPEVKLKNTTWQSLYRVNVRMAEKFRVGRVFIAGDAAHAHSTAGGLGMNTGIQDAYNLGWKLAAVLQDSAKESLLDTYEEERLPIAAWTLNISSERQKAITDTSSSGMASTATKDTTQLNLNYRYSSLTADLLPPTPAPQPTETTQSTAHPSTAHPPTQQSGESTGTPTTTPTPRAGDRAPDAKLADGSWLFDLYRGTQFIVLAIGDPAAQALQKISGKNIKTHQLKDKAAIAAYGNREGLFVIRPDGYIGLTAAPGQEKAVSDWLLQF